MSTHIPGSSGQSIIDIEDLLVWAFRTEQVERTQNTHPDARIVCWAVMALPAAHTRIVSRCARLGISPDWRADTGPVVDLAAVRKARTVYAEWVRAMVVLQCTLDGALTRYRVSGPRLEEMPWRAWRARA